MGRLPNQLVCRSISGVLVGIFTLHLSPRANIFLRILGIQRKSQLTKGIPSQSRKSGNARRAIVYLFIGSHSEIAGLNRPPYQFVSQSSQSGNFCHAIVYLLIDFQTEISGLTRLTNQLVSHSSQPGNSCHRIVHLVLDCPPKIS